VDVQSLNYTGGTTAANQFSWQGSGVHEAKASFRLGNTEASWSDNEGLWAIFQFFGKAQRWQPAGNAHLLEWTLQIGNEPIRLPNGNPMTVRYELDMAGNPPFFQKGYFNSLGCVSEIAK
jgi:type VI protein secretion system component VasK